MNAVQYAAAARRLVEDHAQVSERAELGKIRKPVLGRFGHLHLTRQEAPVAFAREDPESLRRLLREEPRLLAGWDRAEEESRREADRARDRCDEVREVSQGPQVAIPPFAAPGERQRSLAGHQRLATALDPVPDLWRRRIEHASGLVAREQDAALFEELADRRDPERERRSARVSRKRRLGSGGF